MTIVAILIILIILQVKLYHVSSACILNHEGVCNLNHWSKLHTTGLI